MYVEDTFPTRFQPVLNPFSNRFGFEDKKEWWHNPFSTRLSQIVKPSSLIPVF